MKQIHYREEMLFPHEGWSVTEQIVDTQQLLLREAAPIVQKMPKYKKALLRFDDHTYPDGRVKVSLRISEYWFDQGDVFWGLFLVFLVVVLHLLQR